jgi:hypothetical protein
MEMLQRLILGLLIALAPSTAAPAAFASARVIDCGCLSAGIECSCTDCVCKEARDEPDPAPAPSDYAPSPTTPKVAPVRMTGVVTMFVDDAPHAHAARPCADDTLPAWLGDSPFASWCVWRT